MTTKKPVPVANEDDLRDLLMGDEVSGDFETTAVSSEDVSDGRIFGLNAVERMILSIVLFLAVSVLGIALLFITGTIALR